MFEGKYCLKKSSSLLGLRTHEKIKKKTRHRNLRNQESAGKTSNSVRLYKVLSEDSSELLREF